MKTRMTSLIVAVIVAMVVFSQVKVVHAEISLKETAKGVGGIAASLLIHSGSHLFVGEAQGLKMEWDLIGRWESDKYKTGTQMAGLFGNAATSELLLDVGEPVEKWGTFRKWLFLGSVAQEILYSIFERGVNGGNDFFKMESGKKKLFKGILITHGAVSLARYWWKKKEMSFGFLPDDFLGGARLFTNPVKGGGVIGLNWVF